MGTKLFLRTYLIYLFLFLITISFTFCPLQAFYPPPAYHLQMTQLTPYIFSHFPGSRTIYIPLRNSLFPRNLTRKRRLISHKRRKTFFDTKGTKIRRMKSTARKRQDESVSEYSSDSTSHYRNLH